MGRIQVFSELLQPTSRPGANPSAQNNVTRSIPPCFSGKMQIGSSPLLRRTSDKALLEPRSVFGVFPAWNVMMGGSEGHTRSWQHRDGDGRGCSQCPSLCSTYPQDLSAASFALPLSLCPCQHLSAHVELLSFGGYWKLQRSGPREVQQSPAGSESCMSQDEAPVPCWFLLLPTLLGHIPFKEKLWKMFSFHFASSLLKNISFHPFLSVFFASSAFRWNNKFSFFSPYPLKITFFQKFRHDPMAWSSLQELKWVGNFSEKPSPSYDCWAVQVTSK